MSVFDLIGIHGEKEPKKANMAEQLLADMKAQMEAMQISMQSLVAENNQMKQYSAR